MFGEKGRLCWMLRSYCRTVVLLTSNLNIKKRKRGLLGFILGLYSDHHGQANMFGSCICTWSVILTGPLQGCYYTWLLGVNQVSDQSLTKSQDTKKDLTPKNMWGGILTWKKIAPAAPQCFDIFRGYYRLPHFPKPDLFSLLRRQKATFRQVDTSTQDGGKSQDIMFLKTSDT